MVRARLILVSRPRGGRSEAVSGRGSSNAISIIPRPPRAIQMPGQAAGSCVRRIGLVPQRQSPFCPRAEMGWMQKRHRTISSSVANRGCGEFFQFYKKEDGSFAGLLAVAVGKKLEPAD